MSASVDDDDDATASMEAASPVVDALGKVNAPLTPAQSISLKRGGEVLITAYMIAMEIR